MAPKRSTVATVVAPRSVVTRLSRTAREQRKLDAVSDLVKEVSTCVACIELRPCMHLVLPCRLHTMCYYCVHAMVDAHTANTERSLISPNRESSFCIEIDRMTVKCTQCIHSSRIAVDSQLSSLTFIMPSLTRVIIKSLEALDQLQPWKCAFDDCEYSTTCIRSARSHARQCGKSRWTCRRQDQLGHGCGIKLDASHQKYHYENECTTFYRCLRDPNLGSLTRRQWMIANNGQNSVALLLYLMQTVVERCNVILPIQFRELPLLHMIVQARRQIDRSAIPPLRPT